MLNISENLLSTLIVYLNCVFLLYTHCSILQEMNHNNFVCVWTVFGDNVPTNTPPLKNEHTRVIQCVIIPINDIILRNKRQPCANCNNCQ